MPKNKPSKRRVRETRAKSFSFVLRQFLALAKKADEEFSSEFTSEADAKFRDDVGPEHSIVTYWECFFPEIQGRDYARSKLEKDNGPKQLLDLLQSEVDVMMSQEDLKALSVFGSDSVFDKACLVGWLLRTESGPFMGLIASPLFDEYFGGKALEEFRSLLAEDFNSPSYLFHEFDECVASISQRTVGAGSDWTEPWPNHPAQYASYLIKKAQRPKGLDLRADLVTALIMASLCGPRDYRPELIFISRERTLLTDPSDRPAKYRWSDARAAVDVGETAAYLTRVTFPTNPADAREWMPCESAPTQGQAGGNEHRTITYPLAGVSEVLLKRAADLKPGTSRYTREGGSVTIPLDCSRVSADHARISLEDGCWYLTDLDSTNGTLLVRVDEDRFHLCRDGLAEERENHVRLRNGDVICLAPDWTNEQPLTDSPAFVFQLSASKW